MQEAARARLRERSGEQGRLLGLCDLFRNLIAKHKPCSPIIDPFQNAYKPALYSEGYE